MGTVAARRALDDNMNNYINAEKDPVMWNLCLALKEITRAIDNLDGEVSAIKKKLR